MKHTLVSVKLVKKAEHWKDKMVGWHKWRIVTKCPMTNKEVTETVHGRQDEAIESCLDCNCT